MELRDLVLVDGVRTPMAEYNGSFADVSAIDLAARSTSHRRVIPVKRFSSARTGTLKIRVISAQKANTANAFSLAGLALSTANLFTAVQPGGSLYGLQHSNPVNTDVAYGGSPTNYGRPNDPIGPTPTGFTANPPSIVPYHSSTRTP